MKNKESLTVKMIKRMYGVSGVLDEYRRGEIDKIGNKAFMILYIYMPLSAFLALLFIEKAPREALFGLIGSNLMIYSLITGYIGIKTSKLKLMDIEVEKSNIKKIRYQTIVKCLGVAIYFSVVIHFLNSLISMMMDDGSFLTYLMSWRHINRSLTSGVIFGVLILAISLLRIKKVED
ncbi:DUF3278 domain-containing protein [Vagococcus carniphilus]|uniref:DUF3278 domain-containing protein n=1 Tax=Vagococcus carniphilus TaxID=218144 RepID=UPI00288F56F4|nr:DUF3278 domain-containing protein [Vagococcus carniphilus]MDT2814684.1 DUF3278 domain-containing protein [Vagococcus carniphilus]